VDDNGRNDQNQRLFQGKLRLAKKRGYTPPKKMRNPRENGPALWFLPPETMRIFAETEPIHAEKL
jgi:hypothetical protein